MHFYAKNAFSKRKLFLNTLELYLLERHVFWQKLCNFELGLETKNEFENWPLYNFFSVYMLGTHSKIETLVIKIVSMHKKSQF